MKKYGFLTTKSISNNAFIIFRNDVSEIYGEIFIFFFNPLYLDKSQFSTIKIQNDFLSLQFNGKEFILLRNPNISKILIDTFHYFTKCS